MSSFISSAQFDLPLFLHSQQQTVLSPQQTINPTLLQELQSFDLNDPLVVETALSVARHQNDQILMNLLEIIRISLPSIKPTSHHSHESTVELDMQGSTSFNISNDLANSFIHQTNLKTSQAFGTGQYPGALVTAVNINGQEEPKATSHVVTSQTAASTARKHARQTDPYNHSPLFVSQDGVPLAIFVHFELPGRVSVTSSIKNHGGKIEKDVEKAEYCVLAPRSQTYGKYQALAERANKPVVSDKFIMDSIAQGKLQDPESYHLATQGSGPSSRRRTVSGSFFRRPRRRKDGAGDIHDSRTTEDFICSSSPQATGGNPYDTIKKRPRYISCTPEPPTCATSTGDVSGRRRFTDADLEYAKSYTRHLAKRDVNISIHHVCTKLAKKIPCHSVFLWRRTIDNHKEEFNNIIAQTKTSIHHHSRLSSCSSTSDESDFEDTDGDQSEVEQLVERSVSASSPGPSGRISSGDEQHEDFKCIVAFLLNQDLEDISEDELWPLLEKQTNCKTAASWAEFLDKHGESILTEVGRRSSHQS